jgi:hypothetical protein
LKAYTDTYTHSLLLLSIVNHHSSRSSSFVCGDNENAFMKENQRGSLYWHSHRFSEGPNRKYYALARSVTNYYQHVCALQKGKFSQVYIGYFIF